jgi:hypothetical protein
MAIKLRDLRLLQDILVTLVKTGTRNAMKGNRVIRISKQLSQVQIMQNQEYPENVEYFNYLGSPISDARGTPKLKSSIAMAKATFIKNKDLLSRK